MAGGKEGGYRGVVMKMLKDWEKATNDMLGETFDEFADDPRARVRIFSLEDEEEEGD